MSLTVAKPALFPVDTTGVQANSTNFTSNMALPVHRWFRYSAGYSAAWVEQVVRERTLEHDESLCVLDPFAGSATTLLACQATGASSIGLEMHPLVARIARAKLAWSESAEAMEERLAVILARTKPITWHDPPSLMAKIYTPETLGELCGLREAIAECATGTAVDELMWLALVAILRVCSPVGTAPWQYVLPSKTKKRVAKPSEAFSAQVAMMASDMRVMGMQPCPPAALIEQDARNPVDVPEAWADLVVTSPPYPNNYDYADSTRIEMTFLQEIVGWGDLQGAVRTRLVRSCSQHMARFDAEPLLASEDLAPIAGELESIYRRLAIERELHGGKKNYHSMVVAYFADLSKTWQALRRACAPGAEALFVVGDSAPYGVYVPVDRWLGELALAAGFKFFEFTKVRDRNMKWKNRKHRVPLHEGILRVGG